MNGFASLDKRQAKRPRRAQITVTIAPHLAHYIQGLAAQHGLTKSAVVEAIIAFDEEKRTEALMAEGYREMT